jgi:LysM repeat protein
MSATFLVQQPVHTRRTCTLPSRRVPEATYRRRRAVVGTVLAVLVAVSTVLAHDVLAGSSGGPASAAASQPALSHLSVTAQPGDTLWSISEAHHGSVSLARYVDKLVDLNGGASIQAGQAVLLP